jgi:xylan 1,4-beta-xylosidase
VGDRAYQVEVNLKLLGEAEAWILLFYNHKAFVGVGFTAETVKTFQYAEEQTWARLALKNDKVRVRLTNNRHVITFEYSHDNGSSWKLHPTRMEVAGINHNVFGGFLSLKIGIYCTGKGKSQITDFQYRAITES